jgi:predicted acylesterase/phospholipase RssA
MRLKLAFQGGGAKFVPLLAAAQAFAEAEAKGRITVTGVAGTSAGAIVAAAYAGRGDLGRLHAHLNDKREHYLELTRRAKKPNFKHPISILKMILGVPLIPDKEALGALRDLMDAAGVPRQFGGLPLQTHIMVTELVGRRALTYVSTDARDGEINIENVLWHSCGLPYVFKTHKNSADPALVDGGICENLPSECLKDVKDDSHVVGITFIDSSLKTRPTSAAGLGLALLDTAIENSIRRAKQGLAGRIVPVDTKITTFDFEEALSKNGLGAEYEVVRHRTEKEIDKVLLRGKSVYISPEITEATLPYQRILARVYRSQHAPDTSYRILKSAMVAVARSLVRTEEDLEDDVCQIVELMPTGKSLQCFRFGLQSSGKISQENGLEGVATWRLFDYRNEERKIEVLPIAEDEKLLSSSSSVLVSFTPPIEAVDDVSKRYQLQERDFVKNSMDGLRDAQQKCDRMVTLWDRIVPAERAEMVLAVPKGTVFSALKTRLPTKQYGNYKLVANGRPMTTAELGAYEAQGWIPNGYQAYGWCCDNLEKEQVLGVEYYR